MMEDENAFTPTLCTALVSRDRWSKHAYQNASDPYASDLIAFCKFHSFLVEVQTNAGCTRCMRCMYNNNLEIKIAGSSCRPQ